MDVEELKKKRTYLYMKIRKYYNAGKNAKDIVYEYHNILDELRRCGVKVEVKTDYLTKEYWQDHPSLVIQNKVQKSKPITPSQDSFILSLAWVSGNNNEKPEQVKKVQDYFNELGLPIIDESVGEIETRMEHVMRYEFKGSEESFRMLKMCTQFVLDTFAKTDFEKFNIAIYGKKKKY
jgi:hypothetical protein